jgi:putative ABC transport system permease protein
MSTVKSKVSVPTGFVMKWRTMMRVSVRMMFHDKLKLLGTLAGVVFAVLLANQQAATFLGLVQKNVMVVDNAGADLWVVPALTQTLQSGKMVSDAALKQARGTPGVAWAEPLLYGGASMSLPGGGSEPVQLVGTRAPEFRGGPWNIVRGKREDLGRHDAMFFEDSERAKLGGLNIGSLRELSGHDVEVVGFTWGLVPFGPSFAFTEYDTAREILHTPADEESFVLVSVAAGHDVEAVKRDLAARVPEAKVITRAEFKASIVRFLVLRTGIGITFGVSTLFGLIVGFVIVSLSMFSTVVDNMREFGTLKAIGATTLDLARLLWVQAALFGLLGSLIGLALITQIASATRSPNLAMQLPPLLLGATPLFMVGMCVVASGLALMRLRSLEPAMVFR